MAEGVKRINVTLPIEQVDRIREVIAERPAEYRSVSAFVVEAIAERLAESEAHQMLLDILHDLAGTPTDEDLAWADEALRLSDEAARKRAGSRQGAA
jgi:Arc/MetJ-type ribon-helix-helix transcriptional regulator